MIRTDVAIADASVAECHGDVRRELVEWRRELLSEIQSRVREVRELASQQQHSFTGPDETVEVEPEDDLPFALIQMKAEILKSVNEAVRNLDEGTYGYCAYCGEVIASSRLRAMPFAVRCRDCGEIVENEQHRERVQARRVPAALASRD